MCRCRRKRFRSPIGALSTSTIANNKEEMSLSSCCSCIRDKYWNRKRHMEYFICESFSWRQSSLTRLTRMARKPGRRGFCSSSHEVFLYPMAINCLRGVSIDTALCETIPALGKEFNFLTGSVTIMCVVFLTYWISSKAIQNWIQFYSLKRTFEFAHFYTPSV